MELTPYVEGLRRDLAAAAAPGGPDITRAADMLAGSIESSTRLLLLEALSDAAAEITARLADGENADADGQDHISVEVRLRGRDAQLIVTRSEAEVSAPRPAAAGATPPPTEADSGDLARITLRMPESLKEAVERMAAAEAISVNAWLVRAISHTVAATRAGNPPRTDPPGRGRLGRRVTGFAQA